MWSIRYIQNRNVNQTVPKHPNNSQHPIDVLHNCFALVKRRVKEIYLTMDITNCLKIIFELHIRECVVLQTST